MREILDILLTSSVAFVITFLALPVVIHVAEEKKLYDIPDERKVHSRPISSLGGIAIFGGFILASLLSIQGYFNPEFQYFFAAALVIFFLGLKDDLVILSATKKFLGQIIAASILIHLGGIKIESMYGILGFYGLPEAFSLALTYLTIILIINSFNLIDGVDGLASSLGILTMLAFGSYFFYTGLQAYALMAFAMAGSLAAFLIFNYHPAKIFMGDSGSLMIGLISSILVIKFINVAESGASLAKIPSSVVIGIGVISIPLIDTIRVFGIRILSRRSPFSPDRNHLHHLLLDKGMSHSAVTFTCVALNIVFLAAAWFFRHLNPNLLLLLLLLIALLVIGILYTGRRNKSSIYIVSSHHVDGKNHSKTASKVINITEETEPAKNN